MIAVEIVEYRPATGKFRIHETPGIVAGFGLDVPGTRQRVPF
jgi:hypothetical protein